VTDPTKSFIMINRWKWQPLSVS